MRESTFRDTPKRSGDNAVVTVEGFGKNKMHNVKVYIGNQHEVPITSNVPKLINEAQKRAVALSGDFDCLVNFKNGSFDAEIRVNDTNESYYEFKPSYALQASRNRIRNSLK